MAMLITRSKHSVMPEYLNKISSSDLHSAAGPPMQKLQQAAVRPRGAEAARARAPLPLPGAALAPPRHQRLQAQHGATIAHHPCLPPRPALTLLNT